MRLARWLTAIALLAFSGAAFAQGPPASSQIITFTTATSSDAFRLAGSTVKYHMIQWWAIDTLGACSVKVEQSATGTGGWTDLITAQTCTTNGSALVGTVSSPNYYRITVTSLTGGTLLVRYSGFDSRAITSTIIRTVAGDSAMDEVNDAVRVVCVASSCSGGGGGGGTSSDFGVTFPTAGTAAGFIDANGDMAGATLDAGGRLGVTGAGGTFPVTGTFWQAIQPVSGPLTDTELRDSPVPVSLTSTTITGNVAVTGTFWQATQPVSGPLTDTQLRATPVPVSGTITGAGGTFPVTQLTSPWIVAGGGTAGTAAPGVVTIQGIAAMTKLLVTPDSVALPANQSVNVSQINGVTTSTGAGAVGTGSQRVAIGQDVTTIAGSAPGTAGSASTNVVTVQGIASMTPLLVTPAANSAVNVAQVGGTAVVADPCQQGTKVYTPISQTSGTQLVTGTSAKKIYICHIDIVTATAQNVNLVAGTGSVCATSTHQIMGGTTAATGWNFAANGGIATGVGGWAIGVTSTNADNICLLQSGSGQISGVLVTSPAI